MFKNSKEKEHVYKWIILKALELGESKDCTFDNVNGNEWQIYLWEFWQYAIKHSIQFSQGWI